jgi:hypothetical protein
VYKSVASSEERQNYLKKLNPQAGMIKPFTQEETQGFQQKAAGIYDPQKEALKKSMSAKLKQTLQSGQEQIRQDLSGRGFLRSGEQIQRSDIQRTVAEADMALQEAGYLADIETKQGAYGQQLQSEAFAGKQQQAQVELQNQIQTMGINQQEFANMQTDLARQAQTSQSQSDLLLNPSFTELLTNNPALAKKLLQNMGFNIN